MNAQLPICTVTLRRPFAAIPPLNQNVELGTALRECPPKHPSHTEQRISRLQRGEYLIEGFRVRVNSTELVGYYTMLRDIPHGGRSAVHNTTSNKADEQQRYQSHSAGAEKWRTRRWGEGLFLLSGDRRAAILNSLPLHCVRCIVYVCVDRMGQDHSISVFVIMSKNRLRYLPTGCEDTPSWEVSCGQKPGLTGCFRSTFTLKKRSSFLSTFQTCKKSINPLCGVSESRQHERRRNT